MALDILTNRLGLNASPAGAIPLDGDLAALDPSTSPLHLTDAVLGTNMAAGTNDLIADPLLAPQTSPVVSGLNGTVLDLHAAIEGFGDNVGLIGTVHGVTNLGETVGLGKIGGDNLVTHVLDAPSDVLAGNLSDVTALPTDVGNIATAAVGLVNGALADVAAADTGGVGTTLSSLLAGGGDAAIAPITDSPLLDLTTNPIATGLNAAVLDIHSSIEGFGDNTGLIGTVHGVTNLGETIGLGEIGGDNLVTHVLDAPGDVLAGNLGDVTALPGDVGNIATAATGLVDGVASDAAGLVDGPALGNVLGGTAGGEGLLGGITDAAGLGNTGGAALGGLGAADAGGLVTDVQHLASGVIGEVPALTGAASALGGAAGADGAGPASQLPTLASLFGTSSAPGAHDAADASAGPSGTGGGAINVLGTPITDGHTLDLHALALPAQAPAGVAVAALGDGGLLHFGSTGGGGDALSGLLPGAAPAAAHVDAAPAAAAAQAPAELPIDPHAIAGLDHLLAHHA